MNFNVTTVFTPSERTQMKKQYQEQKRHEMMMYKAGQQAFHASRRNYSDKSVFFVKRSTRPLTPPLPSTPPPQSTSTKMKGQPS